MTYATRQDMIDRYGLDPLIQVTDRADPPAGVIDEDVLASALEDADALVNSYIAKRYNLPLSGTSLVLRRHAAAIAWYDLCRGRYTDADREAFEDARKFLGAVSRGEAVLDVEGSQPQSAPAEARVEGPSRIFSRSSLREY